jgi:diguanylate cyclase (GGDEF)-like protein
MADKAIAKAIFFLAAAVSGWLYCAKDNQERIPIFIFLVWLRGRVKALLSRLAPKRSDVPPRFGARRYARQRRMGFPLMSFVRGIEEEFQDLYLDIQSNRIKSVQIIAISGIIFYFMIDLTLGRKISIQIQNFVLLMMLIPCFTLPRWAILKNYPAFICRKIMLYCTIFLCFSIVGLIYATGESKDWGYTWHPLGAVLMVTTYIYYLTLISIWQILFCSVLVAILYLIPRFYLLGYPIEQTYNDIFYLAAINMVSFTGRYFYENQDRNAFLMEREMRMLASRDVLVNALNRRTFQSHLDRLWLLAQREKKGLILMVVDLDFFKQINDQYGHAVGDLYLRVLADILNSLAKRPLDAAGRMGGDEFAVVWYDIEAEKLTNIQEWLQKALANITTLPHPMSLTCGAVWLSPSQHLSWQLALHEADMLLYEIKRQGRGRVGFKAL